MMRAMAEGVERPRRVVRNIDFETLRSLRARHGAVLARGQVVVREGDTSSEFYVVLQGAVEFTISDRATSQEVVVGRAGPGDFFGEIACFGGLPRTASATAAEEGTMVLFFDRETAVELLRTSPRFALGVIQRVGDRVSELDDLLRAANEEIVGLRGQLAVEAAARAAAAAETA
jgi:CRP-like cAMP-binding protein